MPVGGAAVHRAVLAHGRNDDAVRQGNAALLERRKEMAGRGGHAGIDVGRGEMTQAVFNLHFVFSLAANFARKKLATWAL